MESGDVLIEINETAVFLSEPRRQATIESGSAHNATYPFFALPLFISTDVQELTLSTTYIKTYFHISRLVYSVKYSTVFIFFPKFLYSGQTLKVVTRNTFGQSMDC